MDDVYCHMARINDSNRSRQLYNRSERRSKRHQRHRRHSPLSSRSITLRSRAHSRRTSTRSRSCSWHNCEWYSCVYFIETNARFVCFSILIFIILFLRLNSKMFAMFFCICLPVPFIVFGKQSMFRNYDKLKSNLHMRGGFYLNSELKKSQTLFIINNKPYKSCTCYLEYGSK